MRHWRRQAQFDCAADVLLSIASIQAHKQLSIMSSGAKRVLAQLCSSKGVSAAAVAGVAALAVSSAEISLYSVLQRAAAAHPASVRHPGQGRGRR